jgi:hypothetical protein
MALICATRLVVPLGITLLIFGKPCFAAQQGIEPSDCSTAYENHNQIEYGPLKVRAIRGTSVIQVGNETQPGVPGACLVLFTEGDHKLVASVKAAPTGASS